MPKNNNNCCKHILCPQCPFKLDFFGKKQNLCYRGKFRRKRHNHKKTKDRIVMRF
jgi:hypothetical protein